MGLGKFLNSNLREQTVGAKNANFVDLFISDETERRSDKVLENGALTALDEGRMQRSYITKAHVYK